MKNLYPLMNWAVAKCEGLHYGNSNDGKIVLYGWNIPIMLACYWHPSDDWAQGGPIIEREKINLHTNQRTPSEWVAEIGFNRNLLCGPTPLIAAMRSYVASKFGEEVEIPEALIS